MVHELGLERRETVRSLSVVKQNKVKHVALVREDWGALTNNLSIIVARYVDTSRQETIIAEFI